MSNTQAPANTATASVALHVSSVGLAVTASDFQKSLTWYQNVLGFVVERPYVRDGVTVGAAIVAGSARISLNQDDGKKGRDRVKGQGMRIYFNTQQDIDAIAERASAAGATIEEGPSDKTWGVRSFSISDPDGFGITVARPLGS
jgi:uncharacterized glyoxalase superfamily protein PhnB